MNPTRSGARLRKVAILISLALLNFQPLSAWGFRGHTVANLAAVEAIGADGPAFLKSYKGYIGHLGPIPDTWRSPSEPYLLNLGRPESRLVYRVL